MKVSTRPGRHSQVMSTHLGLNDRLFSGASLKDRALSQKIDEGLERVEAALGHEARFADPIADVTARYLLNAGGKRVRPILTLLASQLGDGAVPDVITAATAIEITHLASLYHDDVMDEADLRRGVPSAHTVWGNSVAILAGDLLFARASQLIARLGERAIQLQADTFERLVLGQLRETVGPQPGDDPIEHYLGVLTDKTGSLIATAAEMGAMFGGADDDIVEAVRDYGEKIGVVFQLVDDVIDLAPDSDQTGKTPGTDLRAGVVTLPLLKLKERAVNDPAAALLVEQIEQEVVEASADDPKALAVIEQLRAHPVTEETFQAAGDWAAAAVAALTPLPAGPVKKALVRFTEVLLDRSS